MFIHFVHLVVSLMCFLLGFHVGTADVKCPDEPVFTPSRLVVKYGESTSATCSVCQHACIDKFSGLEHSVGVSTNNGTTISWNVDSLTEWDTTLICFYNDDDDNQCSSRLNITVYQPPKNVHLSLNHAGPMLAGHLYTLQCKVQEVAPVGNLTVTFYRGQTELSNLQSNNREITPVTETFTLKIIPSKEDDGGHYWCEARLDLGAEGPQPPPVVMSQNITATVHYKPQLKGSSHPDLITVTAGNPLHLNCSAVGNPSPSYTWTLPSARSSPFNGSILTIESVTSVDEGQYICSVRNTLGSVTVTFNVVVQNKPQLKGSSHPDLITVTAGNPLHLNCSAVGNPSPSYTWTLPSARSSPFNGSILTIESVTSVDKGQYNCSAHNTLGSVTVTFNVVVQGLQLTSTRLPPTTTRTTTAPNSSTSSMLIHRFTMCLMLLFFALV